MMNAFRWGMWRMLFCVLRVTSNYLIIDLAKDGNFNSRQACIEHYSTATAHSNVTQWTHFAHRHLNIIGPNMLLHTTFLLHCVHCM